MVTQETYTETVFQDTIVYKDTRFKDQTILGVKTRLKPTETFQCTHFTTCHPPNMKTDSSKVRSWESLQQTPKRSLSRKTFQNLKDICGTEVNPCNFLEKTTIRNQIHKEAQCLIFFKEITKHKKIFYLL